MEVTSLELSKATRAQRVARLQRLSQEGLERFAARAAETRDEEALWELVEAYVTLHGARGAATSAHTLRAYRRGLAELLALWPGEDLLDPERDAGQAYARRLLEGDRDELAADERRGRRGRRLKRGPLSPATVALRIAAARALYGALIWAGATTVDPFRDVKVDALAARDGEAATAHAYTDAELDGLLAAARDAHERVLLLLGAHAGLRVSEMVRLLWQDVDLRAGTLLVRTPGEEEPAEVMLSRRLAAELRAYAREVEADPVARHRAQLLELRSQYGVYNRLRGICRRAHVEFKGVRALRHAAGARLYRQTHDVGLVQQHLRHKATDMARRYARADRLRLRGSLDAWE